jgi:hypothetical protein
MPDRSTYPTVKLPIESTLAQPSVACTDPPRPEDTGRWRRRRSTAPLTAGCEGSGLAGSGAAGVECSRCGERIDPRDKWDLDHIDGGGPYDYYGQSHARCNRGKESP